MNPLLSYGALLGLLGGFVLFVHVVGSATRYSDAAVPPLALLSAVVGFFSGAIPAVGLSGSWSLDVIPVGLIVGSIFTAGVWPAVRRMFARERAARVEKE